MGGEAVVFFRPELSGELLYWRKQSMQLASKMRFIAVRAWLGVRYRSPDGVPIAEFSWEGIDEGDQRSGRGWATLAGC